VVGSGPDEAGARLLAVRRGVSDRVVFLGRRTPDDVERIVGACDALVLPSEVEGLPYVILEAMALSKPVVATRVYGIPEVVHDGETGLLVLPGNVDELSRALRTVIENADLRARMGRAGRVRFEECFTLERQLADMSALYRELATGKKGDA
jgi:glycosyltransferase involved in cell wall biosynthesis